ncbi:MAG: thioredoxin domain-containing protein [Pseudomonadota bacterium]
MSNRLAPETSLYLQQHADNPVDWYPWGDEAFEAAREAGKPVLLSIGYSACHWCHVMAHESFEDADTAELMNALFINIKVDREERPDIDRTYQTAHQLLTQRGGGWPLTMFLSADDRRPFFGGTYFPKAANHGMPAFVDILGNVADYYREQQDEIHEQGACLIDIFRQLDPPSATEEIALDRSPLTTFSERIAQAFDREYGGIGTAPKFPQPAILGGLLRRWRETAHATEPNLDALFMGSLSLTRMAQGGVFDHVGGGFFRYSVDRYWQIPHFEKMLYDNGALLAVYAEAYVATGDSLFGDTAHRIADWLLDDMQADNGGFFSTRDADSEGLEGKFYTWSRDEVRDVAGDDYPVFAARFGVDDAANFEDLWHLTTAKDLKSISRELMVSTADARQAISRTLTTLGQRRGHRIAPARDEKQLASWNALVIRGLAIAGRATDRAELVDAAVAATTFVHTELFTQGRLLASHTHGQARFAAYLDDHAFLLDALLELLQARWSTAHLDFAIAVADALLTHFEDDEHGGFFFTAHDHEALIHRSKPLADEALPSGNGVALFALQRLGFLLGETRYLDAAERGLRAAWQAMQDYPHGHATLLNALDDYLTPPESIILRGPGDEIGNWQQSANRLYAPKRMVFAIDAGVDNLPAGLAEKTARDGETLAYRCIGTRCESPLTSWEALAANLSEAGGAAN